MEQEGLRGNVSQILGRDSQFRTSEILNYEQRLQIEFFLGLVMQFLNVTALVANSLNIAVFVKLGFKEPSNVSLLALSICDLTATVMSVWTYICSVPAFKALELPFNPDTITILTGLGPWGFVIRCGAWVTVYISFERCLCILMPLKVKQWITSRTTVIIVSIIAVLTLGPMITLFVRWETVWILSPQTNRTTLELVVVNKPGLALLETVMHYMVGLMSVFLAFIFIVVCTVFLVVHLKRSSEWRKAAISGTATEASDTSKVSSKKPMLTKEERLVKMVVSIAAVFIVCFTPTAVYHLCQAFVPGFSLFGRHRNLVSVLYMPTSILQSLSASVNIFIYYSMGTRFRNAFRQLLLLDNKH
ncbi:chemosensory receptor A [Elysia marginata]|uniref:Chemosensory receptor A n=1 Tax=Elysia marginata TaxID=1093978 RepID=A0AAV4IXS5_9GAST|nr:chemosensory receptor A [Elysia marginata]